MSPRIDKIQAFSALKNVMRLFPVLFFFFPKQYYSCMLKGYNFFFPLIDTTTTEMGQYSVLSTHHDHWLQVIWEGIFIPDDADREQIITLDQTDVESVGNSNQIRIKDSCALMRAPEISSGIRIDVYLPPKVKKVIVHKFGKTDAYCSFRQRGQISYVGADLESNPFHV